MFWFILAFVATVIACYMVWRYLDGFAASLFGPIFALGFFALATVPISMTGGLAPGYSQGFRDGYVTKISHRGVIWKTWEGTLQSGSGEMASVQAEYAFSVVDDELVEEIALAAASAKRVRLVYHEYLIKDIRFTDTGYVVTHLEYLE